MGVSRYGRIGLFKTTSKQSKTNLTTLSDVSFHGAYVAVSEELYSPYDDEHLVDTEAAINQLDENKSNEIATD